ncbi:MAG: hypothetical protein HY515_01470 [Candidatus Aenigmarchaeota archaeon]|nr:hypothetical protein [Candidatus Aenigmarchaeota archaeon]
MSEKPKAVFTVVEASNGTNRWVRIGTAFICRDQSLNVVLDALPVNGRIHIREQDEKKK